MYRARTSSKNGPFSGQKRECAGCEQPFPGPMVADVSTNVSETRNVYFH